MSSPMVKRILITNDDGIDAPGLATLLEVAQALAEEVWVVAPAFDQSGVATCISLHDPLRIATLGKRRYSVTGTPADCVTIGIRHLMKETPPDLVLSGINRGANLGAETFYSGTVGAALTALTLGVPALALSQAFSDGKAVRWNTAASLAEPAIRKLHASGWPEHVILNVNFPDVAAEDAKPLLATRQGRGALDTIDVIQRTDMRDQSYYWLKIRRSPQESDTLSETHCLDEGHITVSPIGFERTDEAVRQVLGTRLA